MNKLISTIVLLLICYLCIAQNSEKFISNCFKAKYKKAHCFLTDQVQGLIKPKDIEAPFLQLESMYGKIEKYSFNCREMASYGLVEYYTITYEKSELDIKLVLNEKNKIGGFFIVPVQNCGINQETYTPPNSNESSTARIFIPTSSSNDSFSLLLSTPKNDSFSKILLLIPGSGPTDENSSIGKTKIFLDLSIELAKQGIATIRYSKFQNFNIRPTEVTFKDEYLNDISNINSYLNRNFSSKQRYILGHSLGGFATSHFLDSFAGGIFMACNSSPMDSLMVVQTKYILNLDGELNNAEKQHLQTMELDYVLLHDSISTLRDSQIILGAPVSYWKSLNNVNIDSLIANSFNVPKLFLTGDRDYQVPLSDFNKFKSLVEGHKDTKFVMFSGLNHVLIRGNGVPGPSDYEIPGNISSQVVNEIVNFLNAH